MHVAFIAHKLQKHQITQILFIIYYIHELYYDLES